MHSEAPDHISTKKYHDFSKGDAMKSFVKRALSLMLAVIMLVGIFSISASAGSSKKLPHYSYYTAIGDSNGSAYGLDEYFVNAGSTESVKDGDIIPGGYAGIFADAISADTVNIRCHCGWRTNEFLYTLLGDACGVDYDKFFRRALDFIDDAELEGEGERIMDAVINSDIISINFGSNDIYSYALSGAGSAFAPLLDYAPDFSLLTSNPGKFFSQFLKSAEAAGVLKEAIDWFEQCLDTNVEEYERNIVKVIDAIRDINPDAKLVVLGVFCPISFDIRMNHEVVLDIKTISDDRVKGVNDYLRAVCKEKDCVFADITRTECFGLPALDMQKLLTGDEDVKYSAVKMVHPTNEGCKFIAKQMVNAMTVSSSDFVGPHADFRSFLGLILRRNVIQWNDFDGAYRYRIYRSESENGNYYYIGSSLNTTFCDFLILRGHTYYYKVEAVLNIAGTNTIELGAPIGSP